MNISQLTKEYFEQIYINKFEFEYNNNIYNEYTDIINMKEFNENKVKYCIENFMNWIEYDTLNLLMFNEFEVKYILNQFYKTYYSSINSRSNYNKIKYAIINKLFSIVKNKYNEQNMSRRKSIKSFNK